MRKFIAAAAVLSGSVATSACGQMHHESAGPTVSRSYQVGNFQQIEVAGPYEVSVRTGSNPSVSAQGSEKLLEGTVVEVKGDKLFIHPQEHHGFNWGWGHSGKANFTVTVPQLAGASIAGSGDIHVDPLAPEGNALGQEVLALPLPHREAAIGADDSPPRGVVGDLLGREQSRGETRRSR